MADSDDYSKVLSILRETDYIVTAHQTPKGLILTLPRGAFDYPGQDHESNYRLEYKGKNSRIYLNDEYYMSGPAYSIRLLTMFDIYGECARINYDYKYIISHDIEGKELDGQVNILHLLPPPPAKRQQKLERDLLQLYIDAEEQDFKEIFDEMAISCGVYDGYLCLKELFNIE